MHNLLSVYEELCFIIEKDVFFLVQVYCHKQRLMNLESLSHRIF